MRKAIPSAILLAVASFGLGAQPATASAPGTLADVDILPTASLTDGGTAVTLRLRTLCQPGIQWEGFINGEQGAVTAFEELSLVCDGRQHVQTVVVPVLNPDGPNFVPGGASFGAAIIDEDTLTVVASDTEIIKVR